jgi:putative Mn2+ efflux pump MntP
MTLEALILVALSLSLDAFGASISRGASTVRIPLRIVLQVAGLFGAFAAVAPLAGWGIGLALYHVIAELDHWIAFFLLGGVGLHMFREAQHGSSQPATVPTYRFAVLIVSAFATSIDAAVIGVTLPFLRVNIWLAALVIGATTFFASLIGLRLGRVGGAAFGHRAEMAGGIFLVVIGCKILVEHVFFGVGAPGGSP